MSPTVFCNFKIFAEVIPHTPMAKW